MTDLTDRMRTCAARIAAITDKARNDASINDAVDLLIEAAGVLEQAPAPLGEPMEIIPPVAAQTKDGMIGGPYPDVGTWVAPGGPLPYLETARSNPRACPKCDSRAWKRVSHRGNQVMLHCPACGEQWEWRAST